MLKLGINSGENYILFPENIDSLKIIKRNYYNRYLEKNIDMPEIDGKQIIVFKKMKTKNAINILKDLKDSRLNIFKDQNEFHLLKKMLESKLYKQ